MENNKILLTASKCDVCALEEAVEILDLTLLGKKIFENRVLSTHIQTERK